MGAEKLSEYLPPGSRWLAKRLGLEVSRARLGLVIRETPDLDLTGPGACLYNGAGELRESGFPVASRHYREWVREPGEAPEVPR